jgi:hypothetical protein
MVLHSAAKKNFSDVFKCSFGPLARGTIRQGILSDSWHVLVCARLRSRIVFSSGEVGLAVI